MSFDPQFRNLVAPAMRQELCTDIKRRLDKLGLMNDENINAILTVIQTCDCRTLKDMVSIAPQDRKQVYLIAIDMRKKYWGWAFR
jgi:hypothetical protein